VKQAVDSLVVLFCIYLDGLLQHASAQNKIEFFIDIFCVGVLAYADGVVSPFS